MKQIIKNTIGWDTVNWKRAIDFWNIGDLEGKNVLDLGAGGGGLSLLFALHGANVTCSDYIPQNINIEEYFKNAQKLHKKYKVADRVIYKHIDACDIGVTDTYDIVTFKSICGAIGRLGNDKKSVMFQQIYRALKPSGTLYFCENMEASKFHMKMRREFSRAGKNQWQYLTLEEYQQIINIFKFNKFETFGLLGCLGPKEPIRRFLGHLDIMIDRYFADKNKYIISVIANKE